MCPFSDLYSRWRFVIAYLIMHGNAMPANGHNRINNSAEFPPTMNCEYMSNGYYEYPHECSAYIFCSDAEFELKYCVANTLFNKILQICDTPESIDCREEEYMRAVGQRENQTNRTLDSVDNPCLDQKQGDSFPLESDCHQYILCLGDDQSVVANCPVGAWYDPKSGNCGSDVSPTACLESQVISTTPSSTTASPEELCADQDVGVSYPFVENCEKYILCLGNGEAAIVNCIYNAWYDPITGNCGPNVLPTACAESTPVTTTTLGTRATTELTIPPSRTTEAPLQPGICAGLINGEYISYPDNCSKYIVCVNPIPIAFYCTPGYYFSENLQQCVDLAQSDCPATQTSVMPPEYTTPGYTPPSICENNSGASLPFPDNCGWFIQCINDNVYMMAICSSDKYYDPAIGICSASASPDACRQDITTSTTDISSTTRTTTSMTTTSIKTSTTSTTTSTTTLAPFVDPCVGVPLGKLVPYPNDCTKFIKCVLPTPVVYDCVPGQEFSAELERCMAPWFANCTVTIHFKD